jgi:hypothetical protein
MKNLIFVFLISTPLWACIPLKNIKTYLDVGDLVPREFTPDSHFLFPNELMTTELNSALKDSAEGVYVSVGTDRSFNNASVSKATHLLVLDYDDCVIEFNVINTWLLDIAKDRNDYLHLRLKADFETWKKRYDEKTPALRFMNAYNGNEVSLRTLYRFWEKELRQKGKGMVAVLFEAFHAVPAATRTVNVEEDRDSIYHVNTLNANYLHYDNQFKKIQEMARAGKIEHHQQDITQMGPPGIKTFVQAIEKAQLKISVLDESNCFFYCGTKDFKEAFKPVLAKTSFGLQAVPTLNNNQIGEKKEGFVYYKKLDLSE